MAQHPSLAIKYAQRSDTGRHRRVNEDTSAVHALAIRDQRAIIAAIADGMGGARAGAEASAYCCARMHRIFRRPIESLLRWIRSPTRLTLTAAID
jgi:serine/threonine protein phosphatase PrpC